LSPISSVDSSFIAWTLQAKELTRALDIESVLCLADRTPLGRVEEVRSGVDGVGTTLKPWK
jgi:hypothetical protein